MVTPALEPDPRPRIVALRRELRRTLGRRLITAVILAMVVAAALAALPHRQTGPRTILGRLPQGTIVGISHRFGWPEVIVWFNHLAWQRPDGSSTPFDFDAAPADLRGFVPQLRRLDVMCVNWRAAIRLYLACLGACFGGLAIRPVAGYRRTRGHLETALCPQCGYPTFGLPAPRCPECGQGLPDAGPPYPRP